MIKVDDFGVGIRIKGYPEQIALEFEMLAREIRRKFCQTLGEDIGNEFYEGILANVRKTEEEILTEYEKILEKNPGYEEYFNGSEVAKTFDRVMEMTRVESNM